MAVVGRWSRPGPTTGYFTVSLGRLNDVGTILINSQIFNPKELSLTFDLAGVVKACPWILPIASRTPAAATADKFRAFATSRFMERLNAKDREGKEPDM